MTVRSIILLAVRVVLFATGASSLYYGTVMLFSVPGFPGENGAKSVALELFGTDVKSEDLDWQPTE